jgi:hypothetical protein
MVMPTREYEPAVEALLHLDVRSERGPSLAPTLYLGIYLDPVQPEEVREFLARTWSALGTRLRFYQTESMTDPKPIDERKVEQRLAKMLTPGRLSMRLLYLNEIGDDGVTAALAKIDVAANRIEPLSDRERRRDEDRDLAKIYGQVSFVAGGFLLAGLPLDHLIAEPARFVEWTSALAAVTGGRLAYGCAGIGITMAMQVYGSDAVDQQETARGLLMRHPGLDVCPNFGQRTGFVDVAGQVHPRVRRAAWLTLLPEAAVRELGGLAHIESALAGTPARVQVLPGGVTMIQASPIPRIGDVTIGDRVPEYVAVERLLKPIRYPETSLGHLSHSMEWGERWQRALDGDEV